MDYQCTSDDDLDCLLWETRPESSQACNTQPCPDCSGNIVLDIDGQSEGTITGNMPEDTFDSTRGQFDDLNQCYGWGYGTELIFQITVPHSHRVEFTLTDDFGATTRLSYGGDCPGEMSVRCKSINDYRRMQTWTNMMGDETRAYFVVSYRDSDYTSGVGAYTLKWALVDLRTQCEDVMPLSNDASVEEHQYSGTTSGAKDIFDAQCDTYYSFGPDFVASIVVEPGYTLKIWQASNDFDSTTQLSYGPNCGDYTAVACEFIDSYSSEWTNDLGIATTAYYLIGGQDEGLSPELSSGNFDLRWTLRTECLLGPTDDCPGTCQQSCQTKWDDYFAGCGDYCNPQELCNNCPTPKEECAGSGTFEGDLTCYPEADDYPMPRFWQISDFSSCSVSCGGGQQTLTVTCSTGNEDDCEEERPVETQECNTQECPYWDALEFGACSISCGVGERVRLVQCSSGNDLDCEEGDKPEESEECNQGECPQPTTTPPCVDDDAGATEEAARRGYIVNGCESVRSFQKDQGLDLCDAGKFRALARELCPASCGECLEG